MHSSPVTMETRKLQEVGGGTYTVSIPKAWATARGLEAGTPVNLYTHLDGSIVVRSRAKDSDGLSSIRVEVDGGTERAERALSAAQAVGFERVTLVSPDDAGFDAETCRAVRSLVRRFVGTELVDERESELVVRNLLDASDVSVRQSVVQLQYVALSVHEEATASFLDADAYTRLRERETEIERLCGMVTRHFSRGLVSLEEVDRVGVSRPELFEYYETARQLSRVACDGLIIARAGQQLTGVLPDDVADELESVADATRRAVERTANAVLEGKDTERIHDALDACATTRTDLAALEAAVVDEESATSAMDTSDVVAAGRSLDALRRTLDRGRSIGDVALQRSMRAERL